MAYTILLFYKYVSIADPEQVATDQRALCESLGLKGRAIVAQEGINVTLEGLTSNTDQYIAAMRQDSRFADIWFKQSPGTGTAFPRLSIKVRSEIVSAHLGEEDVDPNRELAGRVTAEQLHQWLETGEEVYVVDMRNGYEQIVGHFSGSILSQMENFRDLPEFTKQIESLKDKKIVPVCTGGVRCEKAASYLVKRGFAAVYQLDGGIVTYMEKYPNKHFHGQLYVFDNRVTMGFNLDEPNRPIVGKCDKCQVPCESYVNCTYLGCHRHFICCANCRETDGSVFCNENCRSHVLVPESA